MMMLEGPQVRYARMDELDATNDDVTTRALSLARDLEELLERTPQSTGGPQSTRMARAMAASLVDELEALARGARRSGVA